MCKIGTLVRVLYPDYAAGKLAYIEAQEVSGRWIVRLVSEGEDEEELFLSLEESDFEAVGHQDEV